MHKAVRLRGSGDVISRVVDFLTSTRIHAYVRCSSSMRLRLRHFYARFAPEKLPKVITPPRAHTHTDFALSRHCTPLATSNITPRSLQQIDPTCFTQVPRIFATYVAHGPAGLRTLEQRLEHKCVRVQGVY